MVEQLEDIEGYTNLSMIDKLKFTVSLKYYLDTIEPTELKTMDILNVRIPKFKLRKSVYYCDFLFGDKKEKVTIEFKKSMFKQ